MLLVLALTTVLASDAPELTPPPEPAVDAPVAPPELRKPLDATAHPDVAPQLPADAPPLPTEVIFDEAAHLADLREHLVRIGYTMLGGAIGIALPLLIGVGWTATQPPCPMFAVCDVPYAAMVSFLPLTVGIGVGVPHHLLGGRAGAAFGLGGGIGGYLIGTSLLAFVSVAGGTEWPKSIPAPAAAFISVSSLAGAVAGLELRDGALRHGAGEWSLGRGFAEGAAFWFPAAVTELAVGAAAFGLGSAGGGIFRFDEGLFFASFTVGSVAAVALSSLVGWGAHRALGGKGGYWQTLVGSLASAALGAGFVAMHMHGPPQGGVFGRGRFGGASLTLIPIATIASLIAMVGPVVGLEWSDALERETPTVVPAEHPHRFIEDVQLQGGVGPNGSASLGFSGTF